MEIHLGQGIKFEHTISTCWDKKSDRVAVIKIAGLAVGKTLDFTAEISIDTQKIKFEEEGIIKIGKADLGFVCQDKNFMFDTDLQLLMVKEDKGDPDTDVEENFTKFEALKIMELAKQKALKGNKVESDLLVNDFLLRVDNKKSLGVGFKKQMWANLKPENRNNSKNYAQVRHMMSNNMQCAEFQVHKAPQMNMCQKRMKSKRSKY